jgi:hypothetical protein
MPELQQPDIAGNFLSSYYTAQQKQQADADRQRNMQRQDVADERASQQFDMQMDLGKIQTAKARTDALNEILSGVDPANEQSLIMAKQRFIQDFEARPEDVAHITMADIPRIKMQTGQTAKELDLQYRRAQIAATNRSNRGGGGGGGSGGGAGVAPPGGAPMAPVNAPQNPMAAPQSFMANLSPKAREDIIKKGATDFNADRKTTEKEILKARETLATASRFEQLLKTQETGGLYGAPIIGGLARGVASVASPEVAEMEAITARLVPAMREPGSGASSDMDMRMFERATIGVDKPTEANRAIASGMRRAAQNMIDYGLFKQAWYQQNGVLLGAAEAWEQYLNQNPIFDPDSSDPVLNANRVPWRAHFGVGTQSASPAAPAGTATPPPAPAAGQPPARRRYDASGNRIQ